MGPSIDRHSLDSTRYDAEQWLGHFIRASAPCLRAQQIYMPPTRIQSAFEAVLVLAQEQNTFLSASCMKAGLATAS